MKTIISYDLGTGGVKASLYGETGQTLAKTFVEYDTYYPGANMHEQRPLDWWDGVVKSTKSLLQAADASGEDVACIALSGHSLVAVPVNAEGKILLEQVPIWSDTRAQEQVDEFFTKVNSAHWYMTTGNGFPAPCYSIFKLMWMKKYMPQVFGSVHKVLGSKDYINMMLTGALYTDFSYASGTGAYDLAGSCMCGEFLDAAGLPRDIFPEIVPSHQLIGSLTEQAAKALGLTTGTTVACGGVDNACMALGAVGAEEGKAYTSLGSSSWIAVNSAKPILDAVKKPYVFAHIEKGMYTSAFSIFSAGNSLRWVRENLCRDFTGKENAYVKMDELAAQVPIGSGGILFNPSLAGGTSQDKSVHIRGAFLGLSLGSTREDMIRATLEGITMNLRMSMDCLKGYAPLSDEILFCGGGSKSPFWMQMFADIFDMAILKTNIDQDAASLGAAAIAFKAIGIWKDYSPIAQLHKLENKSNPTQEHAEKYRKLFQAFVIANGMMSELGDTLFNLNK